MTTYNFPYSKSYPTGLFKLLYNVAVMEVSRPDFMGLSLVSGSSLKGLGLVSVSRFKGLGLARDYSIETTRPEKGEK